MTVAQAITLAAPRSTHQIMGAELEELARQLRAVTMRIHSRGSRFDGVGSGVLWFRRGHLLVVTNAHVVPGRRGDDTQIEDHSGRVVEGHVLARDRERDLALLSLTDAPGEWVRPATLGSGRTVRTGEVVVALGHPFGIPGALSVGVVHAATSDSDRWLLADIRLAPGNSGGPLATLDGAVIGINAMIVRGLGVAVPAGAVAAFADRVLGLPNG
jgi:serine protease Do